MSVADPEAAPQGEDEAPPFPRNEKHLNDRLAENDEELIRLDITASSLVDFTNWEKNDFIGLLPKNTTVRHVHLSGDCLDDCMNEDQIHALILNIGKIQNLEELFVFKGNCADVTGDRIAKAVIQATKLKVFMMWGFDFLQNEGALAGALRNHQTLERITITLPSNGNLEWASMDVYAMGFASVKNLKCLCIRSKAKKQEDALISPEALGILMGSKAIESLYLENCGLVDDHTDVIAEELPKNKTMQLLDLKHNAFTDDALYTIARALPNNKTLKSLDLSGAQITEGGVMALAEAMRKNVTLTHLELEGEESRFVDEFDIPEGHKNTDYMQALYFRLRLNRAGTGENREQFCQALNLVSDHLGCIYHLVRHNAKFCDRNFEESDDKYVKPFFHQWG